MTWRRTLASGVRLLVVGLMVGFGTAAAQSTQGAAGAQGDYILGPEDVITVSVYLHPELERTVTVSADGDVTFPPIGEIKAAGMTPKQLGDRIAERLTTYLRSTTAVTVTVTQFMSRSLFISGAVSRPGRYGFERMPSLIDAIGQAGGAIPGADLSRVEIVRREGEGRRTLYADVGASLRDGVGGTLPDLRPGDAIIVPPGIGIPGGLNAAGGAGVGVLGEVARPGLYSVGGGQDLWTVLAVAGGLTPRGDLTNVRIISRDAGAQTVATVNLKQVLQRGARGPHMIQAGDVVYVGSSGISQFGRAIGGLQTILSISRDVLNIVVLKEILEENRTTVP